MKPTISAFKTSPDRGRALARDSRVRWALEEVGQPYDVKFFTFPELKEPAYRELQPFGQIPFYQEGGLVLFESGSIILRIAETHGKLLPKDPNAKARAITWMFAALNTVEPSIMELSLFNIVEKEKPWFKDRLPMLQERVSVRVKELSNYLGKKEWLEGEFTAGDLMMVTVLRRAQTSGLLEAHPNIVEYIKRGETRPAFQRAFEDQLAAFNAAST